MSIYGKGGRLTKRQCGLSVQLVLGCFRRLVLANPDIALPAPLHRPVMGRNQIPAAVILLSRADTQRLPEHRPRLGEAGVSGGSSSPEPGRCVV